MVLNALNKTANKNKAIGMITWQTIDVIKNENLFFTMLEIVRPKGIKDNPIKETRHIAKMWAISTWKLVIKDKVNRLGLASIAKGMNKRKMLKSNINKIAASVEYQPNLVLLKSFFIYKGSLYRLSIL